MTLKNLFSVLILSFIFLRCSSDPLDVDASDVDLTINFRKVHSKLYHADSMELIKVHSKYKKEITEIYNYYLGRCMEFTEDMPDSSFAKQMIFLQSDPIMKDFEIAIEKKFHSLNSVEAKIVDGFKHLKYHLPRAKMPSDIIFINSRFQSNVFCSEKEISIGLERYLGGNSTVIQKYLDPREFYNWIKEGMDARFIERDALAGWISTHVVENKEGNLAERMIFWGKVLYYTKAAFPEMEEHLIMRYKKSGWDWAVGNERDFWEYLVKEKALFASDELQIANMIKEGPTTSGLPEKGGPDRMGQFIGYRMVRHYMKEKEIVVAKLAKVPYNSILQEYKIED
jgi:hypothetical protein